MMVEPASVDELAAVCAEVASTYPMISGGLIDRHLSPDDPAMASAQWALGYVQSKHPEGLTDVLEAFALVSMDFLRLQGRFMATRRYACQDAGSLVADLYGDESKMNGYYLDGLAITYALWPNHAKMLQFLAQDFLPRLQPGTRLAEIGVGHGLMAALAFQTVPDLNYTGIDISPSSLAYASDALRRLGVPDDQWAMVNADAMAGDLVDLAPVAGFDALICCEVLEHVDNPQLLLAQSESAIRPGGIGFVSTVANMEAEDHVYLFEDVDAIRRTLTDADWQIVSDQPLVLPGAESWDPLPVNYSGILRCDEGAR